MRGYWGIDRSTSHCVAFVDADEVESELAELVQQIRQRGLRIAYVDCASYLDRPLEILSAIGFALGTSHPPYHSPNEPNFVRWLDDVGGLAFSTSGVVIVLDNAYLLMERHRKFLTDLIEAFLIQFHHWLERKVPCHLCLQMSACPLGASLFAASDEA